MCSPSVANALSSVKRRECVSNVGITTNTKTVIYKNFVYAKRKSKKKKEGRWVGKNRSDPVDRNQKSVSTGS